MRKLIFLLAVVLIIGTLQWSNADVSRIIQLSDTPLTTNSVDSTHIKDGSLSGSDLMLEFRYLFKAYIDSVYSTIVQADTSFWTDGVTKYYKTAANGVLVEGVY